MAFLFRRRLPNQQALRYGQGKNIGALQTTNIRNPYPDLDNGLNTNLEGWGNPSLVGEPQLAQNSTNFMRQQMANAQDMTDGSLQEGYRENLMSSQGLPTTGNGFGAIGNSFAGGRIRTGGLGAYGTGAGMNDVQSFTNIRQPYPRGQIPGQRKRFWRRGTPQYGPKQNHHFFGSRQTQNPGYSSVNFS